LAKPTVSNVLKQPLTRLALTFFASLIAYYVATFLGSWVATVIPIYHYLPLAPVTSTHQDTYLSFLVLNTVSSILPAIVFGACFGLFAWTLSRAGWQGIKSRSILNGSLLAGFLFLALAVFDAAVIYAAFGLGILTQLILSPLFLLLNGLLFVVAWRVTLRQDLSGK
jgi:hypothetical protein